jgi:hypothetical protein
VDVLRDGSAHEVRSRIEDFFADRAPSDLLLLHLSCHGLKSESGDLYFTARDTRPRRLASSAVSADFVQHCLRMSRSRSIVVLLDCCYGGAFAQGVRVRAAGDIPVMDSFPVGRGRAVITASSAMEYAFEGDDLADDNSPTPSVFTSALVEGLRTGEADLDGDGLISLDELYDFVFDRVRERNPAQTPTKNVETQGSLFLARARGQAPVTAPLPVEPPLPPPVGPPPSYPTVLPPATPPVAGRKPFLETATTGSFLLQPATGRTPSRRRLVRPDVPSIMARLTPPRRAVEVSFVVISVVAGVICLAGTGFAGVAVPAEVLAYIGLRLAETSRLTDGRTRSGWLWISCGLGVLDVIMALVVQMPVFVFAFWPVAGLVELGERPIDRVRGGLALLASAFAIPSAFANSATTLSGGYTVLGLLAIALGVVTMVPLFRRSR